MLQVSPTWRDVINTSCVRFVVAASEGVERRKSTVRLSITHTYSQSSRYGSSFERELTTKPSVSLTAFSRCAAKCARQGISPIFSAFTITCIYVSCLCIDADKQETKNTLRQQRFQKAKEKGLVTNNDSTNR